jgi:hypothetical protein
VGANPGADSDADADAGKSAASEWRERRARTIRAEVEWMFSFNRLRRKYGRITLRSLWDLFMVWVAIINLTLILFDLTYLWLRPTYSTYLPIVTRIYDPVKGIRPHPLTTAVEREAAATEKIFGIDPDERLLADKLGELQVLTDRMFSENPFLRSGQTELLDAIWVTMSRTTGRTATSYSNPEVVRRVSRDFWSGPPLVLASRFEDYNAEIAPLLRLNYFRDFGLDGRLVDNFWKIDLPFLILFWIEFMTRWFLAIRRRTYARWYFFPIFFWYDLLSLIPVTALRPLRLLRVVSMYMRLRQSDLSNVGRDFVSRTVAYFSNIITEEVSDRVAVRLLDEYREEIENGTHVRIIRSTIEPRRGEIERVVAEQIRSVLTDEQTLERFRSLLELNLSVAVEESESLRALPLPHVVVKPVVRTVGEVLLETTIETISATLDSPDGEEAIESVASSVLEAVFYGPALVHAESLAKDISLQIIDHMKEVVGVRKWALPTDEDGRPIPPWEQDD